MPLGGFYGVLVGYLIARRRFPGRQAMEIVSMINYALPGTIVGIAYLIAFNDPPLALTGGALIIVACYVFRYSPTGIRATVALLQQIDRSLEEASASLGAGSGQTFRRVTLPLIAPAFFAGLGVVFIRSMTAISATIFLVSLSWTLITVRILENMTELALGPAAAFSVFVIVVVFVVVSGLSAAAGAAARADRRRGGAQPARRVEAMADRSASASTASPSASTTRSRARSMPCATSAWRSRPGELLTLLGPSGCGKSTTLRMIAGFEEPDEGTISIDGRDVTHVLPNRRGIGFMFQNYALFPHLSVFENVAYGLRVQGKPRGRDRARRSSEVLELVGLASYERQQPHQLSGGEQQRVALARAVVFQPKVLLFDEPLSNLDAKLRVEMREQIRSLQKRIGITTVYVTHDQEEAMAISDRIAVMERGEVVQDGTAQRSLLPAGDRVRRPLHRPHQSAGGPRRRRPARSRSRACAWRSRRGRAGRRRRCGWWFGRR